MIPDGIDESVPINALTVLNSSSNGLGRRETISPGKRLPVNRLWTKIHTTFYVLGNPTGFHLSPGQAHDLQNADVMLPILLNQILDPLADKA